MRRRHLLALCAAGVSGCAGLGSGGGGGRDGDGGLESPTPTPTQTGTPTATTTPTATPVRRADTQTRPLGEDVEPLREITVDLLPERLPFAHGARIDAVEDESDNLVPRLTVRVRNRSGRARGLETPTRGIPLPTRRLRGPNGNGIVVRRRFPEGAGTCPGSVTPTPEPTPSTTPTPTPTPTPEPTPTTDAQKIEPGETVTRTYRVFSDPNNPDGCFPAGRYRVDQRYVVVTDGDRLPYRWGFTVTVR